MQFTPEQIRQIIKEEVSQETKQPVSDMNPETDFVGLGLDSLSCIYVLYQVENRLGRELNPSIFWDYPTINSLSEYLFQTQKENG
jgi:acyl carrier protein